MSENLGLSSQYLTFLIEDRVFAFEVLETREVLSYLQPTPMPDAPEYVVGLVNVRGTALLVVDLRMKFGIAPKPPTDDSAIIVLEQGSGAERTMTGVLVDAVKGVIKIDNTMVELPPKMGDGTSFSHVLGIGKVAGDFVIILRASSVITMHRLLFPEGIVHREASANRGSMQV